MECNDVANILWEYIDPYEGRQKMIFIMDVEIFAEYLFAKIVSMQTKKLMMN